MNIADRLCERIASLGSPIVVGLDPVLSRMPQVYLKQSTAEHPFERVADAILRFNKDIIDVVCELVPAVKPQMAFYEQYGSHGVRAFEQTVQYAKQKGLIVVEDGKRNDIGNTALAYANGHLGAVEIGQGATTPSFDVDFLTVSPFLGSESLQPFVDVCAKHNKGIFVLARTSNSSSGEIQEAVDQKGNSVSASIAHYIASEAEKQCGNMGYSAIGAVVGATYPDEAKQLRAMMPKSIFLVPGYGAQGATAADIAPNFNPDGFGAIVNSSREILYAYEKSGIGRHCTRDQYMESVKSATLTMCQSIMQMLREQCRQLAY